MTTAARVIRRSTIRALAAGVALAILAGCENYPSGVGLTLPDPENIVRVTVTLVPVGGGTAVRSMLVDPDGSQLPQPVGAAQGTLTLVKNTTYNGSIELLNNLDPNNVIDISAEIKSEADFHRFLYTFNACAGVSNPAPASFDVDTQSPPQPLGLTFQVVVPAAAATTAICTLHVALRHFESNKGNGLGSNFETELSLSFPVSVSP